MQAVKPMSESLVINRHERFLRRRVVVAVAGRIAQSVEHSANIAAVQGSSPCMTIIAGL